MDSLSLKLEKEVKKFSIKHNFPREALWVHKQEKVIRTAVSAFVKTFDTVGR
jgi:hypothetical protein